MNEFEQKAFRYQFLGDVLDDAKKRAEYYMDYKRNEDGSFEQDENGRYILTLPEDDYNRSRYEAALKIIADLKQWALK